MNILIKITYILLFLTPFFVIESVDKIERTFAMIKPHAVKKGRTDEIVAKIQRAGFTIIALKKMMLTEPLMSELYKNFVLRSWFRKYVKNMTHQLGVVMILEKQNAVKDWDKLKRSIRKHYREFLHNNSVHGSDTVQDARREIAIFFKDL